MMGGLHPLVQSNYSLKHHWVTMVTTNQTMVTIARACIARTPCHVPPERVLTILSFCSHNTWSVPCQHFNCIIYRTSILRRGKKKISNYKSFKDPLKSELLLWKLNWTNFETIKNVECQSPPLMAHLAWSCILIFISPNTSLFSSSSLSNILLSVSVACSRSRWFSCNTVILGSGEHRPQWGLGQGP